MIAFILILFAHVGPMGQTDSNSITTQEFTTSERCSYAGNAAKKMTQGTVKQIEFVCVPK